MDSMAVISAASALASLEAPGALAAVTLPGLLLLVSPQPAVPSCARRKAAETLRAPQLGISMAVSENPDPTV